MVYRGFLISSTHNLVRPKIMQSTSITAKVRTALNVLNVSKIIITFFCYKLQNTDEII